MTIKRLITTLKYLVVAILFAFFLFSVTQAFSHPIEPASGYRDATIARHRTRSCTTRAIGFLSARAARVSGRSHSFAIRSGTAHRRRRAR